MVRAAVGTALASPAIVWILVPFAALGAILQGHPFEVFYNAELLHLLGTPAPPRYGVHRRFACAMAATMIAAAAWSFQPGMPAIGHIVGFSLAVAAFVNVSTGFCIPSFIVRSLFGKVARG